MKICSYCKEEKQPMFFYKCKGDKSGLSSRCKVCAIKTSVEWSKKNRVKINSRRMMNRKPRVLLGKDVLAEHHRIQERNRYWKEKDLIKNRISNWKKNNTSKIAEQNARRKCSKLQATPEWANRFFILEAYSLRRFRKELTGIDWHVDHIVPIKSKYVCGLHNEFNIALIPASLNCSKQNRYWPDMP